MPLRTRRRLGAKDRPARPRPRPNRRNPHFELLEIRALMAAVLGPLVDDSIAAPLSAPLEPLVAGLAPLSGKTIRTAVPGEAIIAVPPEVLGATPPLTWLQDRLDARALGGFRLIGAQPLLVDAASAAESTSATNRAGQTELLAVSFEGTWPAEHVAAELGRFDGVLWAAPNYRYEGAVAEFVPNDPQYPLQNNFDQINAPAAWDVTLGSPSVTIAVLDMGVELTHPDLKANIWTNTAEANGAAGVDDDGNGFVDDVHGWDFVANDNDPSPITILGDSHGTHVAGVAAAMTDNKRGVAGTAGQSTILPLRIYGSDGGFTSTILAQAWKYAADAGVKIANLSYNIDAFVGDPIFTAGLQYFYDHGGLSFTSAGNNSWRDPARQAFEQTLFVVGVDASDRKSSFSNYGAGMDLAAPAEEIASTVNNRDYGYSTGTSGASPQAAGIAALIWAAHPNFTRDQVAAALIGSTDDIDALNPRFAGQLGSGRLNAGRAVTTTTLPAPRIERLEGLPADGATVDQRATIDGFDVSFDQVMDSTTVNSTANWDLRGAGLDGQFDTSDDVVYSLQSSQYMVGTNRMHVSIGPIALSTGAQRLTLSSRLANPFGVKLDGNNDGVGGDSYVRTFTVGLAAPRQLDPDGSLIYEAPIRGVLTSAGAIDRYHYQLDAGQTLTVRLTSSAALQGRVKMTSPGGTQLGGALGMDERLRVQVPFGT